MYPLSSHLDCLSAISFFSLYTPHDVSPVKPPCRGLSRGHPAGTLESAEQSCARPRRQSEGRGGGPREADVKTQRALSDEQERVRVEGLRILARMIARHALAQHQLSAGDRREEASEPPPSDEEGATGGPPERTDDAA